VLAVAARRERAGGAQSNGSAVSAGAGMRRGAALPGDLGYGRSARDAGRDGRIGEQTRGTADRKRKAFGLGEPAAGASGVGCECSHRTCARSRAAGSLCFMFGASGEALRFARRARTSSFLPWVVRRSILVESSLVESLIGKSNKSAARGLPSLENPYDVDRILLRREFRSDPMILP
jgi:hypothetical protein